MTTYLSDSEKKWCQKVYEYLNKDPERSREEGVVIGGELLKNIGRGTLPITSKVIATLFKDNRFSITQGKQQGAERVYLKTSRMQMLPSTVLPPALYTSSSSSISLLSDSEKKWCQVVFEHLKTENSQDGSSLGRVAQLFGGGSVKGKIKTILRKDDRFYVSEGNNLGGTERVYLMSLFSKNAKKVDKIPDMKLSVPVPTVSHAAASGGPSAQSTRSSDITLVSTMKPNGATYESLLDGKYTPDANINRDSDPVNNNIVNDDDNDDDNDDNDIDDKEKVENDGSKEDSNIIKKGKISFKINNMESRQLRVDALTAAIGERENDTDINNIIDGLLSPKEPHGDNVQAPVDIINSHRQSINKKQHVAANTAEEQFHAYTTFATSVKEEPPSLKISAASTVPSSASTLPPILGTLTDTFLGLTPFTGPSHVTGHLLDAGCTISTRASRADAFIESTLFGLLDEHSSDSDVDLLGIGSNIDTNEEERGTINLPKPTAVYLNTHEPFCFVTVGVQGGGKSHTLGCVLEACLVPVPEEGIAELSAPMSALVLHFDPSPTSVCEVTGLIRPSDKLSGCNLSRNLPREKMIVLVSPSFYKQRKAFYGDYCEVRPLLFSWSSLTADHLRCIMQLTDADNQLYVATLLNILQEFQRDAVIPKFEDFITIVKQACNIKGQEGALSQRLSLLSSIVRESKMNREFENVNTNLEGVCLPGNLVVVDLTDPLLAAVQANGIFQVLVEQFRSLPLRGCGKVLALDEAHKFMDGQKEDGLSHAIVNCARLIRHDGLRLLVSTQSPKALAPELLELVSVCAMHRFHSRDWWSYLEKKLYLPEKFTTVSKLQPGHALVFASRASLTNGSSIETDVFTLRVRQRVTADRGATRKHRPV
jgi:hypothetical protein